MLINNSIFATVNEGNERCKVPTYGLNRGMGDRVGGVSI